MKIRIFNKAVTLGVVAFVLFIQFIVTYPVVGSTIPLLIIAILLFLIFIQVRYLELVITTIGIFFIIVSVVQFFQSTRLTFSLLLGYNICHLILLYFFIELKHKDES
jgi:hypothetical protein